MAQANGDRDRGAMVGPEGRGVLYVVGSPIGNLDDMTFRGVRTLREADLVVAEDTRRTRKLLSHFGISKPLLSFHEHSRPEAIANLLDAIAGGKHVAYLCDAGMPGVSDPGSELVAGTRNLGAEVRVIPGPSAVTAAMAATGWPAKGFVFVGFLPRRKAERVRLLRSVALQPVPVVAFESPLRLVSSLEEMARVLPGCSVVVARELTKIHEEVRVGSPAELIDHYSVHPARGEVSLVVLPSRETGGRSLAWSARSGASFSDAELAGLVESRLREGLAKKEAIRLVARDLGIPRRQIYSALCIRERKVVKRQAKKRPS